MKTITEQPPATVPGHHQARTTPSCEQSSPETITALNVSRVIMHCLEETGGVDDDGNPKVESTYYDVGPRGAGR